MVALARGCRQHRGRVKVHLLFTESTSQLLLLLPVPCMLLLSALQCSAENEQDFPGIVGMVNWHKDGGKTHFKPSFEEFGKD